MVIKNRNKTYMKTIIFLCLLFCISSCNKNQTFYCVKGIVYSKKDSLPIENVSLYFPSGSNNIKFRNALLATNIKTNKNGFFYVDSLKEQNLIFYLKNGDNIQKIDIKKIENIKRKDTFDLGIIYLEGK